MRKSQVSHETFLKSYENNLQQKKLNFKKQISQFSKIYNDDHNFKSYLNQSFLMIKQKNLPTSQIEKNFKKSIPQIKRSTLNSKNFQ